MRAASRRELPGAGERGVALVLTLMVLLMLTGLALAFLSVSAFEPRISRNLSDAARARYLAEAGIEVGYNTLVAAAGEHKTWSPLLATVTAAGGPWVALPSLTRVPLPGLTAVDGTYSVGVRNDSLADDTAITGEATVESDPALDANGVVIMQSTGNFGNTTRTVEVVVKHVAPPSPGASPRACCVMSNWREF